MRKYPAFLPFLFILTAAAPPETARWTAQAGEVTIVPPLTITAAEIERIVATLAAALEETR